MIGTGQSLSVGAASNGLVFTAPSASSRKLSLGARGMTWPIDAADPELSLAPLAEPIRPLDMTGFSQPYPNNIYGESFHTAMGAQLSATSLMTAGTDLTSVHSVVGQGAASITVIQQERHRQRLRGVAVRGGGADAAGGGGGRALRGAAP